MIIGMGIDYSDIDQIIYRISPSTTEKYAQKIGQTGRSKCVHNPYAQAA